MPPSTYSTRCLPIRDVCEFRTQLWISSAGFRSGKATCGVRRIEDIGNLMALGPGLEIYHGSREKKAILSSDRSVHVEPGQLNDVARVMSSKMAAVPLVLCGRLCELGCTLVYVHALFFFPDYHLDATLLYCGPERAKAVVSTRMGLASRSSGPVQSIVTGCLQCYTNGVSIYECCSTRMNYPLALRPKVRVRDQSEPCHLHEPLPCPASDRLYESAYELLTLCICEVECDRTL